VVSKWDTSSLDFGLLLTRLRFGRTKAKVPLVSDHESPFRASCQTPEDICSTQLVEARRIWSVRDVLDVGLLP